MDSPERPAAQLPVACTLTGTPGAFAERMAEYRRLFREHLAGRSRTGQGIRFRFRAEPGVEDWVRDLARREQECCGFFDFTVTTDARRSGGTLRSPTTRRPGRRWTSSTGCLTPWEPGIRRPQARTSRTGQARQARKSR